MSDSLIMKLAQIAGYRYCEPGETVFEQDSKADFYYLVLDGLVEVQIKNKHYTDQMRLISILENDCFSLEFKVKLLL